jgi:hypothetical protein
MKFFKNEHKGKRKRLAAATTEKIIDISDSEVHCYANISTNWS